MFFSLFMFTLFCDYVQGVLTAVSFFFLFFFCKQKPAYEMRISDWSSDVCSSDLIRTSLAEALYSSDSTIALTATDLPEPVVPATSRCGMRDRSATVGRPAMSLPSASVSALDALSYSFERSSSLR